MVCPIVQALASGLSHIQGDNNGLTIYTTHISVDLAHFEIDHANLVKGGIMPVFSKTTN